MAVALVCFFGFFDVHLHPYAEPIRRITYPGLV
jgi:hypothetical protein